MFPYQLTELGGGVAAPLNDVLDGRLPDSDIAGDSRYAARVRDMDVLTKRYLSAGTVGVFCWEDDVTICVEQRARKFAELMKPAPVLPV